MVSVAFTVTGFWVMMSRRYRAIRSSFCVDQSRVDVYAPERAIADRCKRAARRRRAFLGSVTSVDRSSLEGGVDARTL
jgi:hypothetical protein